jgi:hypothetical protein
MPHPLYSQERNPVPIVKEVGRPPKPVWTYFYYFDVK